MLFTCLANTKMEYITINAYSKGLSIHTRHTYRRKLKTMENFHFCGEGGGAEEGVQYFENCCGFYCIIVDTYILCFLQ